MEDFIVNSRERINLTLNHNAPDRTPRDFGSTAVTGISASFVYRLRRELGLPDKPVKIYCPYQMLGEVDGDLRRILKVDVVAMWPMGNLFGYDNTPVKPFTLNDGTPVLVPEGFNTDYAPDGSLYQYACGDKNYPPSAVMPKGGFYFDATVRSAPVMDDDTLDPADNLEEFSLLDDETLRRFEKGIGELYANTDCAIISGPGGLGLGDIAFIPGTMLSEPKGVRDIADWYISPLLRPDYVKEVFERQMDIALKNLEMFYQAVGDKISVVFVCGADLGSQGSLMLSLDTFREFYLPNYKKMNDWIHKNTGWKAFKHSCGAIEPLIPLLIEAGFDIINPVQISAAGMDPVLLKQKYGDKMVFWGGGVDTQQTLPYGTPDDVRNEVQKLVSIFNQNGGFVFNTIHNTQPNISVENFLAMIEALDD